MARVNSIAAQTFKAMAVDVSVGTERAVWRP
jgi:hypothetical protein